MHRLTGSPDPRKIDATARNRWRMKRSVRRHPGLLAVVLAFSACASHAATSFTEEFATNLSGWTNLPGIGFVAWKQTTDVAQVQFALQQPFAFPESAVLLAGTGASGGAFNGDYDAVPAGVLGFDFMAVQMNPSALQVEWRSGTNIFFKSLGSIIGSTGVWHSFCLPLGPDDGAFWAGASPAAFAQARTSVTAVAITVQRNGSTAAQQYRLDRVYLDRRHAFGAVTPAGTTITAGNLRTGRWYGVEGAATPSGSFVTVSVVTAALGTATFPIAATNAVEIYRLVTPLMVTRP